MTIGTDRVRQDFNPSGNPGVWTIKEMTAQLIDMCQEKKELNGGYDSEAIRLWALAQTAYEEAAMWAVKALTTGAE